jgi:hypothetical protein
MMRTVRLIVSWFFLAEAILCIGWVLWSLSDLLYDRDTAGSYAMLFAAIVFIGVFGLASWAMRREQLARRGWVIAAALLNLPVSMAPLLLYGWIRAQGFGVRPGVFTHVDRSAALPLVFGIAALLVLPRKRDPHPVTSI